MKNIKENKIFIFGKNFKNKIKKITKALGPGFITGSADDDPSGIGTYSMAGAQYGPLLLWLIPFQLPMMYAMQEMCARIGLITGHGLAANMKNYFPKPVLYTSLILLVIANSINIGADISIMAASLKLIFGYNAYMWAVITTVVIVATEIFISYHTYAKILLLLSSFLFSYVITAFMTTSDWVGVLQHTFIPYLQSDKQFLLVVAGFVGTTISPYLFFWQTSQEIEEKLDHKTEDQVEQIIKDMPRDTFIGMFFSQLMAWFMVITCYFSLHLNGITQINTAADAALALKPFAGDFAYLVFSLGIIGAGFLGIPVLAGSSAYALSELCNKKVGLANTFTQAKFFYSVIAISTCIGLGINFIDINPIQALLYAAIVNCIVAVPFIIFILMLANNKDLMGKHTNSFFANIIGVITFLVMLASALIIFVC